MKGICVRNINELEVEALPQDLPHEITVNMSFLKTLGSQILVKDLNLGSKVKAVAQDEEIVATVQEPMSEEELQKALEAPTETVEDVKVVEKEKKEEVVEEETGTPSQDLSQENK